MKSIYERVLDLRDRISLDGDDSIYEEDHLLLDEVLDLIGSIEMLEEVETQIYDYNNTVDIYKELEMGAKLKKQEKLLELYRCLDENANDYDLHYDKVDEIHNKIDEIEEQIKEL